MRGVMVGKKQSRRKEAQANWFSFRKCKNSWWKELPNIKSQFLCQSLKGPQRAIIWLISLITRWEEPKGPRSPSVLDNITTWESPLSLLGHHSVCSEAQVANTSAGHHLTYFLHGDCVDLSLSALCSPAAPSAPLSGGHPQVSARFPNVCRSV